MKDPAWKRIVGGLCGIGILVAVVLLLRWRGISGEEAQQWETAIAIGGAAAGGVLWIVRRRPRAPAVMPAMAARSRNDDVLRELVPGQLWLKEHPVRLAGCRFLTRMTVIRLDDGLYLHSPVEIDAPTRSAIEAFGEVRGIIAPSTFHHFFVASAQRAFPSARTYAIAGLEAKRKDLHFDELLGEEPPAAWAGQMDQVIVGNRIMREVDLLHRASRTLVAVDLVENFRDETPGTNALLRGCWRLFGMWGRPRPAPELRLFTRDKAAARAALDRLLAWDFERAIIAHGELLEHEPKQAVREAWRRLLEN